MEENINSTNKNDLQDKRKLYLKTFVRFALIWRRRVILIMTNS